KSFSKKNYKFLLECCRRWNNVCQGGNMWGGFLSWADACKNVLGLTGLQCWDKFDAYEQAGIHGGFRVMHREFCIVSEFPIKISRRKHCEDGPTHEWRDGFKIYHLNNVMVPGWLVDTPADKLNPELALTERNADVQREIIRKIGAERMLNHCNAQTMDEYKDKTGYTYKLMNMAIGNNIRRKYLYFEHASLPGIFYAKPVPPEVTKALHGRAWILSMVERTDLNNLTIDKETEIIANLPDFVS
ncbi:MAG: hypothetical protein QME51_06500, partial [Planctomycetota bacterium]|nr:hypothetical protein [Planctomycetota bacterium]